MYTIQENNTYTLEVKRSKFIAKTYKVNNVLDVNSILLAIKEEYYDATHYCYAYIINDQKKCSDDNEPSGTAGLPILQVLEKNHLNMVLCVVVRYFGGIKLGAGGLLRAYTKASSNVVKASKLIEIIPSLTIEITTTYEDQKTLDYIIKNYKYQKIYNEDIKYIITLPKKDIDKLSSYHYTIINEE